MSAVSSSIVIDAPVDQVYALVSDITRTGEWSPECARCRWLDGATSAEEGARLPRHESERMATLVDHLHHPHGRC